MPSDEGQQSEETDAQCVGSGEIGMGQRGQGWKEERKGQGNVKRHDDIFLFF